MSQQTPPETRNSDLDDSVLMTDHSYDGIMEYDNPTPGWWNLIWFGSIVFSLLYVLIYPLSPMIMKPHQKLAAQKNRAMEVMFSEIANTELTDDKMLMLMNDEKWQTIGASIFKLNCAKCHGSQGEGFQGPNMTDDYYKNIKNLTDFHDVILNGAAGGAMPPQVSLSDPEITVVAAYMASLRGQNLEGPRPAEGELIPPWPKPSADSSAPEDESNSTRE
jgi:cytochrome c oxidase cbb3-type subunit III